MGKLTGTHHGDAANDLLGFYVEKATQLEAEGQYFMVAVALALAVEAALLAYLLVEFGDDSGGELQIPDDVAFAALIEAANDIDVLRAPIDTPSQVMRNKTFEDRYIFFRLAELEGYGETD